MTTKAGIRKIINHWNPGCKIKRINLPSSGLFNENWIVELGDRKVVVRIYPKDAWKAKKEDYLYRLIRKKTDVPVPMVLCCDISRKVAKRPYLILSYSRGKIEKDIDSVGITTIRDMGACLAKLHSIKIAGFGWIVGTKVKPRFEKWEDFMDYDFRRKIRIIRKYGDFGSAEIQKIAGFYNAHKGILRVKCRPSLLHKDYHLQNIFISKGRVSGIIDIEWGMGGHNELDISKSMLFMFEKHPELEREFLEGYCRHGNISGGFRQRYRIYRFTTIVGNLSLAFRRNSRRAISENKKRLLRMLE